MVKINWWVIVFVIGFVWWIIHQINHYKKLGERHLDENGYYRNGYNKLVHRDVAYHSHYISGYKEGKYKLRYREYDVHHVDRNKLNNHPDNLQILTREEHKKVHGR